MMQWIFGADWIHSILSSLGTYLLCLIVPRKYVHIAVFIFVMGYMTAAHGYRMYVSYMSGIFDFTGTQMVLTMKLTSFAFNLYDGTYDRKRVFADYPDDKKKATLYGARKHFAIESLPNPIEFLGYVFCFTCLLAGPAFEYQDYVRSVEGTIFQQKDKNGKVQATAEPSSVFPGLKNLVIGLVCMALHLVAAGKFPLNMIYNKEFIAANPDPIRR